MATQDEPLPIRELLDIYYKHAGIVPPNTDPKPDSESEDSD